MLRQECDDAAALLVDVLRAFPVLQHLDVGQQRRQLRAGHGRVGRVVAGQDDARSLALPDEVSIHIDGARRVLLLGPFGETLGEILGMRGMLADRVLQDGRGDAIGRAFGELEAVARTDAAAQGVELSVPQMIHERQLIRSIG